MASDRHIVGQRDDPEMPRFAGIATFALLPRLEDVEHADLKTMVPELHCSLGEELLKPTRIYVRPVKKLLASGLKVKGISHITGGGFYENIPRCIPDGLCAKINRASLKTPAIFNLLQKQGGVDEHDMFNTFNMGVGMVLTVPAQQADKALDILHANGEPEAYKLGVIAEGEGVELC